MNAKPMKTHFVTALGMLFPRKTDGKLYAVCGTWIDARHQRLQHPTCAKCYKHLRRGKALRK